MSFEKLIRIPQDRIGVLIGKSGKTKREIEKRCSVSLQIDSDSGEIFINGSGNFTERLGIENFGNFPLLISS